MSPCHPTACSARNRGNYNVMEKCDNHIDSGKAPRALGARDRGLDFGTQRLAAPLGLDGALRQHQSAQIVWSGTVIPTA